MPPKLAPRLASTAVPATPSTAARAPASPKSVTFVVQAPSRPTMMFAGLTSWWMRPC